MRSPEGYEKADIDKYLKTLDCWYTTPTTMGFGKSGTPDRIGCIDGAFFAIEVKRESKMPTSLQEARMREIHMAGGRAFWGTAAKVIPEMQAWIAQKFPIRARDQYFIELLQRVQAPVTGELSHKTKRSPRSGSPP